MNRRGFLSTLGLGTAALTLDPERLLWTPKKTIFLPPARVVTFYPKFYSVNVVISGSEFDGYFAKWLDTQRRNLNQLESDFAQGMFDVPIGFATSDAVELPQ